MKGEVSHEEDWFKPLSCFPIYQGGSSVAVLLCLCVSGFICGVCYVIICSSSLFLLVSREECPS